MTTARRIESGRGQLKGEAPKEVGRPTIKSKAVLDEIYMRLCDGQSLRKICRDDAIGFDPQRAIRRLLRVRS